MILTSPTAYYNGPRVNVFETDLSYNIEFAVPGITKDEVSVSLPSQGVLEVIVEKATSQSREPKRKYLRREFSFGKTYKQQFNIPDDTNLTKIEPKTIKVL